MNFSPPQEEAVLDDIFNVLSHPYRRRILARLHARNPQDGDDFDPGALAGTGVARDADAIELVHNHLPKLDDIGFVDWDRDEHVVRRGPRYEEVAPLIELMVAHGEDLPGDWP